MTTRKSSSTANDSTADSKMVSIKVAPASAAGSGRSSQEHTEPDRYVPVSPDVAKGTLQGRYNSQMAAERAARARIRQLLGQ